MKFVSHLYRNSYKQNPSFLILVNNQLDTILQCIYFPSLHVSSNPVLIRRIELYQYISVCVGNCLVCRSGRSSWPAYQAVTYTEWYIPDYVL